MLTVVPSHARVGQLFYRFSLSYDRAAEDGALSACLRNWTDITESWETGSLATRTADAFVWMGKPTEQG